MRRGSWLLALALLLVASGAAAEQPRQLKNGWTLYPSRGSSARNAVACGATQAVLRSWHGDVALFDGSKWTDLPPMPGCNQGRCYGDGVALSSDGSEVYVEASGRIARWDGRAWSLLTLPAWRGPMGAMTVLGTGQLVVAGQGRIGLGVGATVQSHDAGCWRDLSAIAGSSLLDLWTAGQGGTVMRRDARGWSRMATGVKGWLRGLLVTSPTAAWAWGEAAPGDPAPLVLHYDGKHWSAAAAGLSKKIQAMAGPDGSPWAVSESTISRYQNARWVAELEARELGPDYQSFDGICATERFVFVGNRDRDGGALVRPLAP